MDCVSVIFDLGGVLITWNPDQVIANAFVELELQALVRREVFQHADWLDLDKGVLEETDAIHRFHSRTGIPLAQLEELLHSVKESLKPIPESIELLKDLSAKGIDLYCLSNMPACRFNYIRQRYSFWSFFKGIVISGAVKMIKPNPEIFEYLLAQFQLQPSATVFVDDYPSNIKKAEELGLRTVLFLDANDCRRQLQTMFSSTLTYPHVPHQDH